MLTGEFNAQGVTRVLEAVRQVDPSIRIYQASSSEMFGKVREVPQTELTPFYPRSPYGVSKVFAHYITVNYRESYDLFAVSGILFNHESPRRGLEFVTRKVTDGVARIKLGLADTLALGNLDAQRDWGFAGDYVRAMWLMLQQDQRRRLRHRDRREPFGARAGRSRVRPRRPRLAGARAHSIRRFLRPAEVDHLIGDPAKARAALGWAPAVDFTGLVRMMVDADLERLSRAPAYAGRRRIALVRRGDPDPHRDILRACRPRRGRRSGRRPRRTRRRAARRTRRFCGPAAHPPEATCETAASNHIALVTMVSATVHRRAERELKPGQRIGVDDASRQCRLPPPDSSGAVWSNPVLEIDRRVTDRQRKERCRRCPGRIADRGGGPDLQRLSHCRLMLELRSTVTDDWLAPFSTVKYRLPMPSALPALSVTPHERVCTPFDSVVLSIMKYPTAPPLLLSPGNGCAISLRNWFTSGDRREPRRCTP